jgi:hypothetical protein
VSIPRTMLTSTSLQPTSVMLQLTYTPDPGPGQLLLRVGPGSIGVQPAIDPQLPCRNCDFCKDGTCRLCTDTRVHGAPDMRPLAPGRFSLDDIEDALQRPKTDPMVNNPSTAIPLKVRLP